MADPGEPQARPTPVRRRSVVTALHDHGGAQRLSDLAASALLTEVELEPKPGLVTPSSRGAHTDMDVDTFRASIEAMRPWFPVFHEVGHDAHGLPRDVLLDRLRAPGRGCERSMYAATGGINTHKGAVFAFGLLLGCAGHLSAAHEPVTVPALCRLAAETTAPLVRTELCPLDTPRTYGERAFAAHGLTGARGEAASGFASVTDHALPAYRDTLRRTGVERFALLDALLALMATSQDTTLVKQGALDGLRLVRDRAAAVIGAGGAAARGGIARLEALDAELTERRLSPGGCADLLAVTCFFARLDG